jgi:hypothetical protein
VRIRPACGWQPGVDALILDGIVLDDTGERTCLTATPHLIIEVPYTDRSSDTVRDFTTYAAASVSAIWAWSRKVRRRSPSN